MEHVVANLPPCVEYLLPRGGGVGHASASDSAVAGKEKCFETFFHLNNWSENCQMCLFVLGTVYSTWQIREGSCQVVSGELGREEPWSSLARSWLAGWLGDNLAYPG